MLLAPFLTWVVMRCPVGQHWWTLFAHLLGTLKTTSRGLREVDGSTKQRSVEQQFREQQLFLVHSASEWALLRSQSGPGAGSFLSVPPTHWFGSIRRSSEWCCCAASVSPSPCPGVSADVAVSLTNFAIIVQLALKQGFLGGGGFVLESVVARVCREGGARVTTNMFVRDLDLDVPNAAKTAGRLEVVADGLPLFGGVQLAIDTTLVSPLHSNGSEWRGAGDRDGVVLEAARRRKERTYPELVHRRHNRARLVVLAAEVGAGGLMKRGASFELWPGHEPNLNPDCCATELNRLRRMRWWSLLSCAASRAFASSLLELRSACGADGDLPETFDVEADFLHARLD